MLRKVYQSIFPKNYQLAKEVLNNDIGNELISSAIYDRKPFMVSRFGLTEIFACKNYLDIRKTTTGNKISQQIYRKRGYPKEWKDNVKKEISELSGVFPTTNEQLSEFAQIYIESSRITDMMAIWNMTFEPFFINHFCPTAKLIDPLSLEPYLHKSPWSHALKSKKVLIIHPFEESIQMQYLKREKLFADNSVLPGFELKTLKAVQSLANNPNEFENWTQAYNFQCKKIAETDFDVAIIGAGAYGLPLAAYVKTIGKISIHMGGATQILFGIKGKRWNDNPIISKFYNEYWVNPNANEFPINFKKTDSGCYW